jgi:hypothetical protein
VHKFYIIHIADSIYNSAGFAGAGVIKRNVYETFHVILLVNGRRSLVVFYFILFTLKSTMVSFRANWIDMANQSSCTYAFDLIAFCEYNTEKS